MIRTPAAEKRTSLVRLLLLAGAVAGLFAMHGLGDHGTAHADGHVGGHPDSNAIATEAGASLAVGADHAAESMASTPAKSVVASTGGTGSGVMGLCMAVLAGVLFVLAGLRAWGRLPAAAVVRLTQGLRLAATARERDPPLLVQLSICRC